MQHRHYQTLAETNRIAIVPIVPNRGVITDRNGVVLAQSYSAYTLEIQPARVKDLDATIDALAEIVDVQPRDRKRFRKLLDESKNFESLPLRTRLSDEEVARFAVNRYRFPGVEIKARLFRQYPYGEIASHVVGYIGRINDARRRAHRAVGQRRQLQGLRLHRQGRARVVLRARPPRQDGLRGGRGRRRRPRRAHAVAHAARLRQQPQALDRHQAAGDRREGIRRRAAARWSRSSPSTGDVLAFVSRPGFDPNLFVDGIDSANWEALNESPDKPLLNRPLRGAYPPGSTIKPFLALSALVNGKRTPQQTIFDPGFFQIPGQAHRFRDDKPGGHGTVDMYKSIVVSCDTYYYMLASETDIDDTARFLAKLGFGAQTGIDIEGEVARACCRRASGSGSASGGEEHASGTSATRSRPASVRATTPSRRCSSRTRSR